MLYHLLTPLRLYLQGLNIFQSITFRSVLAAITALLVSIFLGPYTIRKLKGWGIRDNVHKVYCDSLFPHIKGKDGTPTMGGILILTAVLISTFLWGNLSNRHLILVIFSILWLGTLGFLDDYVKVSHHRSQGIGGKTKIISQLALGLFVGLYLYLLPPHSEYATKIGLPFSRDILVNLGLFYIPFVMMVIVASSNAVNLTDGIDGLAIGCVIMAYGAYGILSYLTGNMVFSDYLHIIPVRGSGELTIFCASMVGAGLGFLWFNTHPAEVFMGDTGALALGGALGVIAVIIKQEVLLVLVGGIFVIESLSVIIQVVSYKLRKKRVFLMAPLHHHFQLKGWKESKITVRFWILALLFALFSIGTLKLR